MSHFCHLVPTDKGLDYYSSSSVSSSELGSKPTRVELPSDCTDNGYSSGDSAGSTCRETPSDAGKSDNNAKSLKNSDQLNLKKDLNIMLTKVEMEQLGSKCHKSLCTFGTVADEFDLLITEVVDSCTFWANIDDGVSVIFTRLARSISGVCV